MTKQKSILVVLGMHRSGTSVVTRTFNLLGASPGSNLMEPTIDNPVGYYEPVDIVDAHDALLKQLGYTWDDPRPLPHLWWDRPDMKNFEELLCQLAEQHYSDTDQPIIKDPRLCRLLPLWQKIFSKLGWQHKYILTGRSPLDVAGSLSKRDNFSVNHSYLLWLRHIIESEKWSRDHPRTFLLYNQLLENWKPEIKRCMRELDLNTLQLSASRESEIDDLLDPSLQHNLSSDDAIDNNPELSLFVADAFRVFRQAASGSLSEDKIQIQFESINRLLLTADSLFSPICKPYLNQRDDAIAIANNFKAHNETIQADLEHYQGVADAQKKQLAELYDKVQSLAAKIDREGN